MKTRILLGLVLVYLSGCWAMPAYDEVDYGKTADGKRYLRDTARTWKYIKWEIDEGIAAELKGEPPGGGFKSWNDARVHGIRRIRTSGEIENPEKYIAYLIEQRRAFGLPEILIPPGEPPPNL